MLMNIESIQKTIDETDYWDALILDLEINYFGDEVLLYDTIYFEAGIE